MHLYRWPRLLLVPGGLLRKWALCPGRVARPPDRPDRDSDVAAKGLKAKAGGCRPARALVAAGRFDTPWELMPIKAF